MFGKKEKEENRKRLHLKWEYVPEKWGYKLKWVRD